jgi:hypothetical protein
VKGLIAVASRADQPHRHDEFFEAMDRMQTPEGWEVRQYCGDNSENHTNAVKDMLADAACDYILFMDDDILMPEDALAKMLLHDKDVVSINLLTRVMPWEPYNFKRIGGKMVPMWLEGPPRLERYDACGIGGVLVKRSIFERFSPPWFGRTETAKTDDFFLWQILEKNGVSVYVDLSIGASHILKAYVRPVWDATLKTWKTIMDVQGGGSFELPLALPTPHYKKWLDEQTKNHSS